MCDICRAIEAMENENNGGASGAASLSPFFGRGLHSAMMRISPMGYDEADQGQPAEAEELTEPAIDEASLSTAGRDVLGYLRMTEAAGSLKQMQSISLRFMILVVGVPEGERDQLMSWYKYKIATAKDQTQEEALLDLLAARINGR